jgi:adenylate cyclase
MVVVRKLVAVVFADVVGYSRLMERDEAGTHQRLRELREKLIDPKIAEHGGRTVHTSGDGTLIEFPSATSALRCAVEIQREMGVRNLYLPSDQRIEFRIGINLGDIIVDGADIAGDGVNVAARLEAMAEPGGICVASAVWEQVHEDLGIEFIDSGEQHVKNISKPIRVFRVALGPGDTAKEPAESVARATPIRRINRRRASIAVGALAIAAAVAAGVWQWVSRPVMPAATMASGPPPRSLMVLPFNATAADAAPITLADALTGDVSRALANSLRDVRVMAPNLAAQGKAVDERALGREANVRYLVAGEMRGTGDDIVVTIRLIDTTTAKELASERRAITRARVVDDHELLVARVTAATRLMFQNAEGRRVASEPMVATDAQSLVDRANAIFTGEDLASTRAARKLYDQARERDPALVAAWIGHMWTLETEHWSDFAAGRDERLLAEMDSDSRRAIALDDRDPQAWRARAQALGLQWQWQAALEASDRAATLDPSRFYLGRSLLYIMSGRSAEALQTIAARNVKAGVSDSSFLFLACHAHVHLARYDEAITECERAVVDNNDYWVYLDLTAAYAQTGDMTRATAAKAQLMRRAPDFTISRLEAKQFSNNPTWVHEIGTHFIPGLRKAGVPQ